MRDPFLHAEGRFACLRVAASAEAGHAGVYRDSGMVKTGCDSTTRFKNTALILTESR